MSSENEVVSRSIAWRGLKFTSLEHFTLKYAHPGWQFAGTVVTDYRGQFFSVSYRILSDASFRALNANVERSMGGETEKLDISHEGTKWRINGKIRPDLEGCTDLDLEISPSTNTLPIRRSSLSVGEKIDVAAVWVRFPSLDLQRVEQSYERAAEYLYIYRSSNFEAEISVDESSITKKYDGIWEEA